MSWLTGQASVLYAVVGKAVLMYAIALAALRLGERRTLGKLVDHRVRVLVAHGQIRRGELRRCGLTDNDLYTQLRQRGIFSLDDVRYLLYEAKGSISVVRANLPADPEPPLVSAALEDAAGYPWPRTAEASSPGGRRRR